MTLRWRVKDGRDLDRGCGAWFNEEVNVCQQLPYRQDGGPAETGLADAKLITIACCQVDLQRVRKSLAAWARVAKSGPGGRRRGGSHRRDERLTEEQSHGTEE